MKKFLAIIENNNGKNEALIPIYTDNDCTKDEALAHYSKQTGREVGVEDRFGAILVGIEETEFNERVIIVDS